MMMITQPPAHFVAHHGIRLVGGAVLLVLLRCLTFVEVWSVCRRVHGVRAGASSAGRPVCDPATHGSGCDRPPGRSPPPRPDPASRCRPPPATPTQRRS